jgi:hypothetical protein
VAGVVKLHATREWVQLHHLTLGAAGDALLSKLACWNSPPGSAARPPAPPPLICCTEPQRVLVAAAHSPVPHWRAAPYCAQRFAVRRPRTRPYHTVSVSACVQPLRVCTPVTSTPKIFCTTYMHQPWPVAAPGMIAIIAHPPIQVTGALFTAQHCQQVSVSLTFTACVSRSRDASKSGSTLAATWSNESCSTKRSSLRPAVDVTEQRVYGGDVRVLGGTNGYCIGGIRLQPFVFASWWDPCRLAVRHLRVL